MKKIALLSCAKVLQALENKSANSWTPQSLGDDGFLCLELEKKFEIQLVDWNSGNLDGFDVLNKLEHQDVEMVLLDVMMPKLDGFSVCKEIRKSSSVPIIMITARGEDYERIMGLEIGADDYIVKPFSPGVS